MTEFECTRRIQFCAGHRIRGHESKCAHLHGHNYVALVTARAPNLDKLGRVVDFSVLKEVVGGWIDAAWDHGLVLWKEDVEAISAAALLKDQKLYLLPKNPTAENMAEHLLLKARTLLKGTVEVTRVRLWETENCYAEV